MRAVPGSFLSRVYSNDIKLCDFIIVTPAIFILSDSKRHCFIIPFLTLITTYGKIITCVRNYIRPGENVINPESENHKKRKIYQDINIYYCYSIIN